MKDKSYIKYFVIGFIIASLILFVINFINNMCDKFDNINNPIDIVYTWAGEHNDQNNKKLANNNELKYSLRSIFKYMSWFNKIYIIINSPLEKNKPSWFNDLYKDRIVLIDQKTIFPISEHYRLPCKVSDIIESYICNIPNLSEHFIYMNDDFFINKKINSDHFFSDNNMIYLNTDINYYRPINFNNILNFKKYPYIHTKRKYHQHVPYACTKTSYINFLNEYSEYINWIRSFTYDKRLDIKQCKNYGVHEACHGLHYPYRIYLWLNNLGLIVDDRLQETYLDGDIASSNLFELNFLKLILFQQNTPYFVINNGTSKNKKVITEYLEKKFNNKLYFEK